jgi:putative DNA primase/helicase
MWLPPNFDGILTELKALPHWVLARAVVRNGKLTKPPFQPDGRPASHSNPATWSSFKQVQSAFVQGDYIGVGFVLDGRPHFGGKFLHGFDWDACISDGRTDPEVKAAVERLCLPRLEVSVSGNGLRGFFLHDEPLPSRRTRIDGRSVELYSTARYLTTTGWKLGSGGDLR